MQIIIEGQIAVGDTPNGGKMLQITDSAGNVFILPMTSDAARSTGLALSSSVAVAGASLLGQLPPLGANPARRGNGH